MSTATNQWPASWDPKYGHQRWLDLPQHWHPPHGVTHEEKLEKIYNSFIENGWDDSKPDLVGYRDEDGWKQLITGSHRRAAALLAGILIPVKVLPYFIVHDAWGNLDEWFKLVE